MTDSEKIMLNNLDVPFESETVQEDENNASTYKLTETDILDSAPIVGTRPVKWSLFFRIFHRTASIAASILLVLSVVSLVIGGNGQISLMDYSCFTERASSALYVTKLTAPESIKVNDDIIINYEESHANYDVVCVTGLSEPYGNGVFYFQVQDSGGQTKVIHQNIIAGVVKRHIPFLGSVMLFFNQYFIIILIASSCALLILFIVKRIVYNHLKSTMNRQEEENETVQGDLLEESNSQATPVKKRRFALVISNIVFYLALISVVIGVFIVSGKDNSPRNILGYSYFTVLSESMQSEIPKGSLVITKRVDQNSIRVGDDITFFMNENTTVTHRVAEIFENYQGTQRRAFKTKGVENPAPDKEIVDAQNIIGIVKFSSPGLGKALADIKNNILLISVMFALLILLSICVKVFFANGEKKIKKETPPSPDDGRLHQ